MKNLTEYELRDISGGTDITAFYAGKQFAEDVYNAAGEVVHEIGDFFRGIWDGFK
ncbi:hypothetical protein [Gaetbulibacter aestuarii]|uniref:Bacteriocin n=1 Tax=Gaetbulibacter aestuarii TaxID=1502358 RepID=A0ABW7MUM8_9FLAO